MEAALDVPSEASRPVVVAHSLPAGFDSVRAGEPIHSLHCLRARAPIIDQLPVVAAHSC